MTQELIYTSAPKGLQLGSRGFCTVASTAGMAKPLADRLEALSGYKHLYPPGGESSHLNPVNYAFVTFKLGGKTYYVLSRIADAGLDYTQRSNKLAHHVVLEGSELPPAGPAWLMRQPGFFVTSWDGEPRPIEPRRLPLSPDAGPRKCDVWQSVTGDAGWGGVLAGNDEVSGLMEANIVFAPPGENLLTLVEEAQSLLPPSKRWGATFSTYYSKLPPGVECHWRFLPRDSAEAVAARRSHGTLIVDLISPGRVQQETTFVVAARTGKIRHSPSEPRIPESEMTLAPQFGVSNDALKQEVSANDLISNVSAVTSVPPSLPKAPKLPVAHTKTPSLIAAKPRQWVYVGTIVGILLFGAGVGYFLSGLEVAVRQSPLTAPKSEVQEAQTAAAPPAAVNESLEAIVEPEKGMPTAESDNTPNGHAELLLDAGSNDSPTPSEAQPSSAMSADTGESSSISAPPPPEPISPPQLTLLDTHSLLEVDFPEHMKRDPIPVDLGIVPKDIRVRMIGTNPEKGRTFGTKNNDPVAGLIETGPGLWDLKASSKKIASLQLRGEPAHLYLAAALPSNARTELINEAKSIGIALTSDSKPGHECLVVFCDAERAAWKPDFVSKVPTTIALPKWLQPYHTKRLKAKVVLTIDGAGPIEGEATVDTPFVAQGFEPGGIRCKAAIMANSKEPAIRISCLGSDSDHVSVEQLQRELENSRKQFALKAIEGYFASFSEEQRSAALDQLKVPRGTAANGWKQYLIMLPRESIEQYEAHLNTSFLGGDLNSPLRSALKSHLDSFGNLNQLFAKWNTIKIQIEVVRTLEPTAGGNAIEAPVIYINAPVN